MTDSPDNFAAARHRMVQKQLAERGIRDPRVLAAFESIPRERFIPADRRSQAYEDHPVEIGQRAVALGAHRADRRAANAGDAS